jgi:hypothetical protein
MRTRFDFAARLAALGLAAALFGGCAISESVQSISNSVSSPFESSSSSSGGDGIVMYREDVERLTLARVRAGGDVSALRGGIADLAREQGIIDWASDAPTLEGIESGLRAAGLDEAARRDFTTRLVGGMPDRLQLADHPAR